MFPHGYALRARRSREQPWSEYTRHKGDINPNKEKALENHTCVPPPAEKLSIHRAPIGKYVMAHGNPGDNDEATRLIM